MHNFKKVLQSTMLFLIIICIASSIAIGVFFNTETGYYQDIKYRDRLAGTIDCIFIGASRELCGFAPQIFNQNTDFNCYNLSGSAMSPQNKIAMLEEEIDRNPISTVIIGVGDDDLNYDSEYANAEGEIALIPRIKSTKKQFDILKNNVLLKDYPYVYAVYMNEGTKTILQLMLGKYKSAVDAEAMGWHAKEPIDISASDDIILASYQESESCFETSGNRDLLCDLIEMCQKRNIKVILLSLPIAEKKIWKSSNYDKLYSIYNNIAEEYDCTFIDLNLLINRKTFFSDKYSFTDVDHMSYCGAETATKLCCDIINKINAGEDISDMFYDSYEEAIKHFEYYEIYQSMLKEQS